MKDTDYEKFLRQVIFLIKSFGVIAVVSAVGSLIWNPFAMAAALALGLLVVIGTPRAVKATWNGFTDYNPSLSDYWIAAFGCTMVVAILGIAFSGAITLLVVAFQNPL